MALARGIATVVLLVWAVFVPRPLVAEEILIGVATNFSSTITAIADRFEEESGHDVNLSFASTGKHYAQIRNGAPFDAFLAADAERPELLERAGLSRPGSRFTYAIGKLVLWSPRANYVDAQGRVLETGAYRHLAIANPKLAPYGTAAKQVLEARGLWDPESRRLVRGESIAQAMHFVQSGNAELGLVARSQVMRLGGKIEGSLWEIPQSLYDPIEQQAVLLSDSQAAQDFLAFVRGREAREIIRAHGYDSP